MLIEKITTGFVVQVFDTEKQKYVSQEFHAGDDVQYEIDGNPLTDEQEKAAALVNFGPRATYQPYLPFLMEQPVDENPVCIACGLPAKESPDAELINGLCANCDS